MRYSENIVIFLYPEVLVGFARGIFAPVNASSGVVWKLGDGAPSQVSSSLLDHVVKAMDSSSVRHEFQPSTSEDPPCRGGRCTLNTSRLKRPPVAVVWKSREECQLRCRPRHLTMVQNTEVCLVPH
ncbi:hypothetical protein TNCV_698931 [Trichonephila clavipes]|nr:hypothetical protein TNCV_698931 [Trichonephila clavipes]